MNKQVHARLSSLLIRAVVITLLCLAIVAPVSAAPVPVTDSPESSFQTPGWMTQDILDRLTVVGASVLAPSYLPSAVPFLPSVDAYSGYYSFYWLVPGSPPTFLHVTGTVGGGIPAYSKYDRNVQLVQNATVLGYPAWHDLTPIYDLVYFQIGSVVYSVESNNLGEGSLGIANSLSFVDVPVYVPQPEPQTPVDSGGTTTPDSSTTDSAPPAVAEVVVTDPAIIIPESVISEETIVVGVQGVIWANLEASAGTFSLTGDSSIDGVEPSSFEWTAPRTQRGRTVRFTLTDPSTGEVIVTKTLRVERIPDELIPVSAETFTCPTSIPMGMLAGIEIEGSGRLMLDASDGIFPDIGPNQTFAGGLTETVPETDVLTGVIRTNDDAWVFFQALEAPVEYTTYLFLQTWEGETLLECGIQVVFAEPLPPLTEMGPQDGTGAFGGVGIAVTQSVPEGTSVLSTDQPGQGFMQDGSVAYLNAIPFSDGTAIDSTASPDATPTADGT